MTYLTALHGKLEFDPAGVVYFIPLFRGFHPRLFKFMPSGQYNLIYFQ